MLVISTLYCTTGASLLAVNVGIPSLTDTGCPNTYILQAIALDRPVRALNRWADRTTAGCSLELLNETRGAAKVVITFAVLRGLFTICLDITKLIWLPP